MVNKRLAEAKLVKAQLDRIFVGGSANSRALANARRQANSEITRLEALARSTFADFYIEELPYVSIRRPGGDGIAFSKVTYADKGDSRSAVAFGVEEKDPTQIVLWGAATHQNINTALRKYTRPPGTHRWQDDDGIEGDLCFKGGHQYIAMANSHNPKAGDWHWVASRGLQPVDHFCGSTRHVRFHLRFFSSDDSRMEDTAALGEDTGDFLNWTVIAAHIDSPVRGQWKWPDLVTHLGGWWELGETQVVNSLHTLAGEKLAWVESVESVNLHNAGRYGRLNHRYDGVGYLIKITTPMEASVAAPGKPSAPVVVKKNNEITVSWAATARATWYRIHLQHVKNPGIDASTYFETSSPSIVIQNLKYNEEYKVRVSALNVRNPSEWSSYTDVQIGSPPPCERGTAVENPKKRNNAGLVADCKALMAAKDTLRGEGGRALNWSGELAIGKWDGITLTDGPRPRVQGLSLPGRTGSLLKGTIPPELGQLTALRHLVLSGNQLGGDIPEELQSLTKLRQLSLDRNQLTGTIPSELRALSELQVLQLNGNFITGTFPWWLYERDLSILKLAHKLFLSENPWTGCIPPSLLKVSNNDLADLRLPQCAPSVSCEYGKIVSNPTTNAGLVNDCKVLLDLKETLGASPALNWSEDARIGRWEGLIISGTPRRVTGLNLNTRRPAPQGVQSSEPQNRFVRYEGELSGSIPPAMGDLDALESLRLRWNSLTGEIPEELGELDHLKVLRLSSNNFKGCIPAKLFLVETHDLDDLSLDPCPPEVSIVAAVEAVYEGTAAAFTVTRSVSATSALVVLLSVNDGGGDFIKGTPRTQVTIPANATTARFTVPTDDDDMDEEDGAVTATLGTSAAYTIDSDAARDSVKVRDNDAGPCENGVTIPEHATSAGAVLVSDCETLLAVKDTLRGTATLNWGPTTPIRRWDGITVTGSGKLASISLGNRGLTGVIPPELGSLSNLVILNLHNNRLTGSIPHELGQLRSLYRLYLSGNSLTGCVPASLRSVNTNDLARLGLSDCVLGVSTQRFETSGNKGWAKAGDVITAHFTTEVPLAAPPTATFAGNEDKPVTARPTGSSGMIWTVTYTVTAGDTNRLADFNLGEIRDDDGNTRDPAPFSTGITIDTKAPTVTVPPPTTTGLARADQVIRVAFSTSERLASPPAGTIAGKEATISGSGTSWTASYTVLADDTNTLAFLDLEAVRDRAGNESADPARASSGVTIDTKAPTVKFHSATSSTGTRSAEAGDTIRVDFTVSEPLASDPKVTIAGIDADVTAVADSNGASWTATATVVAGIDVANAPFDLGELRDAAGNTNDPDPGPTGIAIVDDTAPSVTLGTPTSTNDAGSWAKADDKITVPFTVSEALASDPVATIAGQNATITGSGLSWSAAYTVVSSDTNGHALFDLETLTDGAGNSADPDAATLAIKIDTKAPTVTDHDFRTTAAEGEVSDEGDVLTVEFTTSEALALPPWATIAGETAIVTGSGTSWTATYTVVRGDNAADAAFNLGPLRDAAGNVNDPDPEDTGITVKTVVLRTLTTTVSPPNSGGVKVTVVAAAEGAQADFLGGQREWKHPINTTVKAVASANPDYRFDRWSGGVCRGGSEPYTAADGCTVLLDQNKSVTALFVKQCTLTVKANDGGSVSIKDSSGTTWTGDCGTTRTVVADADGDHRFDGWSAGVTTRSAATTKVVVNADLTVTADFEAQCVLRVTAGPGGSVTPSVTDDCGEDLTATATANSDHCFLRWRGGQLSGSDDDVAGQQSCPESGPLTVPTTADTPSVHVWHATFEPKPVPQCTLTVIPGDGGEAGDRSWTGDCGTPRTIYAVPDPNYRFGGWSNGVSATRTTITVNQDTTIRASFVAQCAVTATPRPSAWGDVDPRSGTVDCGQPLSVTATANAGYCYSHKTGGLFASGSEAEGQQSCQTSPTIDLPTSGSAGSVFTYIVHFKVKPVPQCTLTVADGDGGDVSITGSSGTTWTGDCGTKRTIVADPDTNYRFGGWSGGSGVSNRSAASTSVTVSKTMTVTASFVAQCSVTATPRPSAWGDVDPLSGTVDCGQPLSVTATADDGYCYSHKTGGLFVSGSEAEGQQSCQTSPTIDLATSGSAGSVFVYTIHFKVKPVPQCTLTVAAGSNGDVSITGSSGTTWTGDCGTSRTVVADPDTNYRFGSWSGGSGVSNRSAASTSVTVSKTMTLTASFDAECTVTANRNPSAGGRVSPSSGTVACGESLSVTATANAGYCYSHRTGGRFVGGSDDAEGQQSCQTSRSLSLPTSGSAGSVFVYTVHFKVKPASTYTLTVTADTGGTPSGGGSKTAGSTATARVRWDNVKYQFTSWTGTCSSTSTSTTSATCSVLMNAAKSVHANLAKRLCTVSVKAGTGGSVSGGGSVHCGVGSRTVRATASVGYCFTSWSTALGASTSVSGQQSTCTVSSSRTATRPTTARTYTASFTARNYTLTVRNGTGSGSYPARSYARITAPAWICQFGVVYNFSGWTGTTLTARAVRVYMNRDRTITANFATRTARACQGSPASGQEELTFVDEPLPPAPAEDTGELPVDPPAADAGDGDSDASEGDGDGQAEGGQAEGGSGDPPDPPEGGDDP